MVEREKKEEEGGGVEGSSMQHGATTAEGGGGKWWCEGDSNHGAAPLCFDPAVREYTEGERGRRRVVLRWELAAGGGNAGGGDGGRPKVRERRWRLGFFKTLLFHLKPQKSFHAFLFIQRIISGLQNFDKDNVASVVTAADKGGATHVDIACDPELVKLVTGLTRLPVCVSSVDPSAFLAAVEAGASMVEIGNYDSFYEAGIVFSPEQILNLTMETRRILPLVTLSVTVPHTLSLPDQAKLAEQLEQEGVDIIQTEGGKCSSPTKPGVLGLIEKASPTLAAAYSISRAVKIPVMCASGLSAVTAPMAITAGAAGVGVGSAINKLNNVVAMIAEVRSIADSLGLSINMESELENRVLSL